MSQKPKPQPEPPFVVHLIGHAHLDLAYRWRWSETVNYAAVETVERVLQLMEENPELTFAQSQMALYEAIEQQQPELFRRIKKQIEAGRWIVVGGMWVESDMNMPCGESLIRQFLVGRRYARQKLETDSTIAWLPDVFGHNANLPQILAGCGITTYVARRCLPEDSPIFWWEGPDGSRILVYRFPGGYSSKLDTQLIERISEWATGTSYRQALVLYGDGDHGGGPRRTDLAGLEQLKSQKHDLKFRFGTPEAFFKTLAQRTESLPVIRGELNFFARGCYTTQARTKWINRKSENLLLTAEKFAVNALFIHRKSAGQRFELLDAWKKLLWVQFHDNLPGTSIGPVYDDNELLYKEIEAEANDILNEALEIIGARLDTRGEGVPVVVFNPLSWERTETVEAIVKFRNPVEHLIARDEDGNTTPVHISENGQAAYGWHSYRILFTAEAVPSIGYRLFKILPGNMDSPVSPVRATQASLENEFLKIAIDPQTGDITQIFDKSSHRETLSASAGLRIIPEMKINTAWTIMETGESIRPNLIEQIEVTENGPVRCSLQLTSHFGESTFILTLSLMRHSPVLHCHLKADWHESDACLKAIFPTNLFDGKAAFEIPFGHIERSANGDEVPALKWIDLSNQTHGCSLLNDCKYGFNVDGNVMRMTLLRGAVDMDARADEGELEMSFRYYPHAGDWRKARTIQRANELNVSLIARTERIHEGSQAGWGTPPEGPLPAKFSFLKIEPASLIVTAMKPTEEQFGPPDVVIRFYETVGQAVTAKIIFPVALTEAHECNMLEESVKESPIKFEGNQVCIPVGAYEIKTLHVKYAARFAGPLGGEWEGMEFDA